MASAEKTKLLVRDGLDKLHHEHPDKERFSEADVALSAWKLHPRYNLFESVRGKRRAAANGIRNLLGREPKPANAPHWFVLPGVERALSELGEGSEPIVVREFTHPETGEVMTEEQKRTYLNPPIIDGKRPQKPSLSATQNGGYRLTHISHVTEIAMSPAAQNGNGVAPTPERVQVMAAEPQPMDDSPDMRMM